MKTYCYAVIFLYRNSNIQKLLTGYKHIMNKNLYSNPSKGKKYFISKRQWINDYCFQKFLQFKNCPRIKS